VKIGYWIGEILVPVVEEAAARAASPV